ncbi:MAG: hypothetical protein MMC33_003829 [Icmadophila ericetorum]|nr:hypothetical protein [Icmadophila ericetorum]
MTEVLGKKKKVRNRLGQITWKDETEIQLWLVILEFCESNNIELPWDEITKLLSPDLSKDAVLSHARRLQEGRICHGLSGLLIGTRDDYNRDDDLQLSLVIRQVCNLQCITSDWDEIARSMSEKVTTDLSKPKILSAQAIKQHLARYQKKRRERGLPAPPPLLRGDYPALSESSKTPIVAEILPSVASSSRKNQEPLNQYEKEWEDNDDALHHEDSVSFQGFQGFDNIDNDGLF